MLSIAIIASLLDFFIAIPWNNESVNFLKWNNGDSWINRVNADTLSDRVPDFNMVDTNSLSAEDMIFSKSQMNAITFFILLNFPIIQFFSLVVVMH